MVGVAVNVTLVPEQIVPVGLAAMLTLTAEFAFTVIVTELEFAGFPLMQLALDVITQVTASLLTRLALVKVALFVPAFVPFTFH